MQNGEESSQNVNLWPPGIPMGEGTVGKGKGKKELRVVTSVCMSLLWIHG